MVCCERDGKRDSVYKVSMLEKHSIFKCLTLLCSSELIFCIDQVCSLTCRYWQVEIIIKVNYISYLLHEYNGINKQWYCFTRCIWPNVCWENIKYMFFENIISSYTERYCLFSFSSLSLKLWIKLLVVGICLLRFVIHFRISIYWSLIWLTHL